MTAVAALAEQVRAVSEQQARGEAAVHAVAENRDAARGQPIARRARAGGAGRNAARPPPPCRRTCEATRDATRGSPTLATAAAQDEELQHVLRQLRRGARNAVDELAAGELSARARASAARWRS